MGYIDDRTSLLDIGCGTSKIIIDLPSAVALDMNIGKLRYLKKTNPRLINADCNYLPFKDESFSAAICSQVIEHAEEKNIFNEINRVLKKNGILIIGTPDYGKIYWPAIERLYKFFHKGGYANEHINPYTFGKLQMVLKRLNFDILDYSYILKSELIIKAVKRA
jgi:ubiquinone/menaquinone biosynthesis C-methylase UbiE